MSFWYHRDVVFTSGPVVLGSAPGAAAFFVTYETSKKTLQKLENKEGLFFRTIAVKIKLLMVVHKDN